jgi:type I restriction enzyme S subunit
VWEAVAMADDKKPKEQQGLPEGWKWVRLGEVIEDMADGGTPSRNNPEYFNGDINWLVIDDIQRKIFKTKETITVKGLKHSNAKLWKKGTVILSFGATIGEVGIAEIELATKQGIAGIIPQKDKLLNTFLYYVLKHNKHILLRYANQTTIMEVRPNIIKERFKFPLPPLPEQRKIAEILETVDNAIEKTEKIIEKYKRIKQGLMQDLLTKGIDEKGNIRSEKTHKFKDSPLGRIPEEWEVVRLGDVGEIITGSTPPTQNAEYYGDEYLFISAEDIQDKKYIENTTKKLTKLGMNIQRKIPPMSICVVCIASIGKVAITKYECSTNQQINTIIPNLKIYDPEALYYFINFHIQSPLRIEAGLQAVPIVKKSAFSKILIPLPPLSEQKRIAEILSQIDQAIEKEEKYKEKLERLKKGLMEDLLTGKVRVNKLLEGEVNEMA